MTSCHQRRNAASTPGSKMDVTVSTARDQLHKVFTSSMPQQSSSPSKNLGLGFGRGFKDTQLRNLLTLDHRVSFVPAHWVHLNQPWTLFQNENQLRSGFHYSNHKAIDSSTLAPSKPSTFHPSVMNHVFVVSSAPSLGRELPWILTDDFSQQLSKSTQERTIQPSSTRPLLYLGNYYPPPLLPRSRVFHLDALSQVQESSTIPKGEQRYLPALDRYLAIEEPSHLQGEPHSVKSLQGKEHDSSFLPNEWQSMILIANADRLSWGIFKCRLQRSQSSPSAEGNSAHFHNNPPSETPEREVCFSDPLFGPVYGVRRELARISTSWLAQCDFAPNDYSALWDSLRGAPSANLSLDSIWYKAEADSWTKLWQAFSGKYIVNSEEPPAVQQHSDRSCNSPCLKSTTLPPFPISAADPRLVFIPSHHHFANRSLFHSRQSMDYLLQKFRYGLIRRL